MMLSDATRVTLICFIGMLVAASTFLGAIKAASARDDSGALGFFSSMFGAHEPETAPVPTPLAVAPAQAQSTASPKRSPLRSTAGIRTPKHSIRAANSAKAFLMGKMKTVSIFADKTLRRGDAVMTAHGIRVFAGSNSWPYQNSDFIALADAPHLNKSQQAMLLDLDRLPRR